MNNVIKLLTCALLLLSLALTVCACDANTAEPETSADATTEAPTEAPTEEPTEAPTEDAGLTAYKIKVVDAAGNPVANVPVQLCQGELCRLPVPTNADGITIIEVATDNYTAKALWNGSETDSYEFDDSNELTIVLPD